MIWILVVGFGLLATIWVYQAMRTMDRRALMRALRWVSGGLAALMAVGALLLRRFDLALFVGAAAASILMRGRLGRFSFDSLAGSGGNTSKVRSRYLAMELDHDTGALTGRILDGPYAGWDLMDLGPDETRVLIDYVSADAESVNLLESWLDTNRAGWREYFAEQDANGFGGTGDSATASSDPVAEAYEVLGLKPGASAEEIKAAHRELMKGVHPDRGGSEYLAAKINQARDLLLERMGRN